MGNSILTFIKLHIMSTIIAIVATIAVGTIVTVAIINSNEEGEIAILEAGASDVPIINDEDLDELGHLYSKLNEQFEREINDLTTGIPNRHNRSNNNINPLKHYGVYGGDNSAEFKNNDYVNGIKIKYEKANPNIKDGASNFNDIISVMAILYDQQMDTIDINQLKETLTTLFWLSHTFTYYSDELYPCRHGCAGVSSYKCTDIFKDYKNSDLQYGPFTVGYHDEYMNYGQDDPRKPDKNPKEDFRIVTPIGQCVVCGQKGAGCVWDDSKTCYHGGSKNVIFADCTSDKNFVDEFESYDDTGAHYKGSGTIYGDVGETVIPDGIDAEYLGSDDTGGGKLVKTNNSCMYYKVVKYCSKRKELAEKIADMEEKIAKDVYDLQKWDDAYYNSTATHSADDDDKHQKDYDLKKTAIDDKTKNELEPLKAELQDHITNVCEASELGKKYWCDGYKVCLGHKTHYKCPGHKVVVCYGHTNINVTVKILYRDEILKEAFDAFK